MANVAEHNGDDAIWGVERSSKITRRRVIGAGALIGSAAVALGLYFGLQGSSSSSEGSGYNIIAGQATDPNAVGCFMDDVDRVLEAQYDSDEMTPELCNEHCEAGGYAYYAVQWSKECWCVVSELPTPNYCRCPMSYEAFSVVTGDLCGAEGVDVAINGIGECDYACAGDDTKICGGFWSFTVYDVGAEATTPTPTPTSETTCSTVATIRFTDEIAYFEGGGCATLTDMYTAQSVADGEVGEGPLYVLNELDEVVGGTPTGYWLLDRNVRVVDGVTLLVHGTEIIGDADVLRIKSTSEEFYELRGYGGSLSFHTTKVTSWDTENGEEKEWTSGEGRSFINCVTQFDDSETWDCEGASNQEWGECRMDIIDSTMGNMGWFDAESYGLTWKVRGMCAELDEDTGFPVNHAIFEDHNVYGDIMGSEIYGMYYGHYSYGHQGGVWTNNIMRDNIQYGFDPHDDSDELTISYNTVYGNGNHGIIASKRCNNVEISHNEVYNGGEDAAGIFLHRSSDYAQVFENNVHDMQDAGIAFLEASNCEVYDNTFTNVKYGIRLSLGSSSNNIHDNTFDTVSEYGLYTYMGSDEPDVPGNDGRPNNNVFDSNTIADAEVGVRIKEADSNTFTNNVFTGVSTLIFEDSTDTTWVDNDIGTACLDESTDFAEGSIPEC